MESAPLDLLQNAFFRHLLLKDFQRLFEAIANLYFNWLTKVVHGAIRTLLIVWRSTERSSLRGHLPDSLSMLSATCLAPLAPQGRMLSLTALQTRRRCPPAGVIGCVVHGHRRVSICVLSSLALLVLPGAPALADGNASSPTWTVQTDPLTDALGIANLLFERRISNNLAVYAGPSLKLYDSLLADVPPEESYRAYGVEMGARWFWSGTAPTGWWTGLRATIARVTHEDSSSPGGYVSALGGYAWAFDGRWALSLALGVSYFDYSTGGAGVDGILPGAHTGIGIAF